MYYLMFVVNDLTFFIYFMDFIVDNLNSNNCIELLIVTPYVL